MGNNKYSVHYWEQYIVNKYMTLPRVKKVLQKMESEDGKIDIRSTTKVANTCYHDMLTEEIWEIQKKVKSVDFKALSRICHKKAIRIFHDILRGFESVAYNQESNENQDITRSAGIGENNLDEEVRKKE